MAINLFWSLVILVAIVLIYRLYKNNNSYKGIIKNGLLIDGKISFIEQEVTSKVLMYRNDHVLTPYHYVAYKIYCEAKNPITNKSVLFESHPFVNVKPLIDIASHPSIGVYLDKNNPNRYYVDIRKIKISPSLSNREREQMNPGIYRSLDGINYQPVIIT